MPRSVWHARDEIKSVTDAIKKSGRVEVFLNPIFLFLVALLGFSPLLILHFSQLWSLEHYGFFPFVLLSLPIFFWHLRTSRPPSKNKSAAFEFGCLWVGGALLLAATIAWSPNLAAVAAVITCGGLLLNLNRNGQIRRPFAVWLLLLLLIKLPLNLDLDLIFWLQGLNSRLASRILDFVQINHVLLGHVIRVPGNGFMVEEACSGIQSLFTLIAAAGMAMVFVERSRFHSLLLVVFAAFWACMINTIRIAAVVVASVWFEIDISSGVAHELLGFFLFGVAIWMLISSDSLLQFVLGERAVSNPQNVLESAIAESAPVGTSHHSPPESPASSSVSGRHVVITMVIGILGVVQIGVMTLSSRGLASIDPDDPRLKTAFKESTLPIEIGRWTRTGFKTDSRALTDYMGRNSASWSYKSDDIEIVVSVDYPFLGWHELTHCYEAQGCVISERNIHAEIEGIRTVSCEVLSPGDIKGRLWFSEFLESGQPLVPLGPSTGSAAYWLSRIQSSFLRQSASVRGNPSNYQVQLLAYRQTPFTTIEREELLDLHRQTAQQIVVAIQEATR